MHFQTTRVHTEPQMLSIQQLQEDGNWEKLHHCKSI